MTVAGRLAVAVIFATACASAGGPGRANLFKEQKVAEYRHKYMPGCTTAAELDAYLKEESKLSASLAAGSSAPNRGNPVDKELIRAVIHQHVAEVRACYAEVQLGWPGTEGLIQVTFVIGPDGGVRRAAPRSNSTGVPEFACCIAHVTKSWSFPTGPTDGITVVTYPYPFQLLEKFRPN